MRLSVPPEFVEAARNGEDGSMERLLQTLWPHAYRIARSILHDDSLAEDVAQEACAIVYRQIPTLRSLDAFSVWLYRIVVREALRIAKRDAVRPAVNEDIRQFAPDSRLDVLRALSVLAPDLRAIVVLHYYADLTSAEIGTVLRIPSATVRFRLARARKHLKALLSDVPNERNSAVVEVL